MHLPIGTIVNTVAVLVGSTIGIFFGKSIPSKIKDIVFQGLGLCTLLIGFQMGFKTQNLLVVIFSILIGGIIGEASDLDGRLNSIGDILKSKLKSKNPLFTEGLVTAFLIFCVGSLTFLGTLNEGIRNDHTLLFTKSILDGFASIALAATFGIGVLYLSLFFKLD